VWDKEKGHARAEVIYSFGRADEIDLDAIRRLVKSLCRFLCPEDALQAQATLEKGSNGLQFMVALQ
jgi:hypothetical protein